MRISVLGASGWIGSNLAKSLSCNKYDQIDYINRDNLNEWIESAIHPDVIVYLIGKTGNYRSQPIDTCYSHTCLLMRVLKAKKTRRYVYSSSVKVYDNSASTCESTNLSVCSQELTSIYTLSKLLGESVLLNTPTINPLILRISNVIGENTPKDLFFGSLLDDCIKYGSAIIRQPELYTRDYIMMNQLVYVIQELIKMEYNGIINLGSGVNTSNRMVSCYLKDLGYSVEFASDIDNNINSTRSINIQRLSGLGLRLESPFS